jgi:hypothetical protein
MEDSNMDSNNNIQINSNIISRIRRCMGDSNMDSLNITSNNNKFQDNNNNVRNI